MKISIIIGGKNEEQIQEANKLKDLTTNDKERIRKHLEAVNEREDKHELDRRINLTDFDQVSLYTPVHSHIYKTKEKVINIEIDKQNEKFAELMENNYQSNLGFVDYIYDELLESLLKCPAPLLGVKYDKEKGQFDNVLYTEEQIRYIEVDKYREVIAAHVETEDYKFFYSEGKIYEITTYSEEEAGAFIEIDEETELSELQNEGIYELAGFKFKVNIREAKNNPFIFLGYKKDGKIYRSFISPMIPHLRKYAKRTSQHELTVLRHAFPKTAVMATPCDNEGCYDGKIGANAETCKKCNGKGHLPVSKSGYDIVVVTQKFLENELTGKFMPLSEMYQEFPTPLPTIEWQAKDLKQIKEDSFNSVFYNYKPKDKDNNQNESWRTILLKKKAENEALIPFVNYLTWLSSKLIEVSSKIIGKPVTGQLKYFPQLVDLTLAEITEIISDLKAINADKKLIQFFETKMIKQTYGEESKEVLLREIKTELLPFTNVSMQDIAIIIGNDLARKIDLFIYFNYDMIVSRLKEMKFTQENKSSVKEAIIKEAQSLLSEIEAENKRNEPVTPFNIQP